MYFSAVVVSGYGQHLHILKIIFKLFFASYNSSNCIILTLDELQNAQKLIDLHSTNTIVDFEDA